MARFFIDRPIFAWVIALFILVLGGVAITGGFEVALACDILIASENARFADTHARVGVMPGWGLSQHFEGQVMWIT